MLRFESMRRIRKRFTIGAVCLVIGCSSNEPVEHAECVQGEERELACGLYGTGFQTQRCGANFRWEVPGECRTGVACTHQELRFEPCGGLNGRAERSQRCDLGAWPDTWGACVDPDVCIDEDTRDELCVGEDAGIAGRATRLQTCTDGQWHGDEPCIDIDQCSPLDPEARCGPHALCEPNGEEGAYICACPEGWLLSHPDREQDPDGEQNGACQDVDECDDDEANACGANASCENTEGSYLCHCDPGYFDRYGNGTQCDGAESVSAGHQTSCAISNAGHLYCWGNNSFGQAGFLPLKSQDEVLLSPRRVEGEQQWVQVSTGESHSCGITTDGELYCWGRNDAGQIGVGYESFARALEKVLPRNEVVVWRQVSVGKRHSCALTTTRRLFCWGANDFGQLGDGTEDSKVWSTPIGSAAWTSLSAGAEHTCALRGNESFYCWGRNSELQVSATTAPKYLMPSLAGRALTVVAYGNNVVFGDGSPNLSFRYRGALAGQDITRSVPSMSSPFTKVEPGAEHLCGLNTKKEIRCWYNNT